MQELKLAEIEDEVFERYRPKIRKMMRLSPGLNSETAIALLKTHRRSPKQEEFLEQFLLETKTEVPFSSIL